ncbi:MAG: carbohydrate-binding domain-containing protein, partial [Oscillospiraceae bacterium]|nr:carbohydrate-binding domain-containing protein [Oscillospiraceae bacterium]
MRKLYAWVFMFAVLMSGCAASAETAAPVTSEDPSAEMFTERELDYGYEETAAVIELKDKSVTIDSEGTYIIRGSLQDGSLIVDADKSQKIQLVLDGVNINSESSAAIYVKQADKVFITLAEGSENILSNGGSFGNIDENNIDGVIFSKDDLCINGTGSLKINSPADHGIVCKDSLAISGGSFDIEAASHAVSCKEDISITGATFVLNSGKDGIHAENSDDSSLASIYIESGEFVIKAAGDGISAAAGLNIAGGSFNIVSGGGSAEAEQKASEQMPNGFMGGGKRGFGGPGGGPGFPMEEVPAAETEDTVSTKGIKAGGELVISGGQFVIDSADDGLHSNSSINIKGGDFKISTGDDGFHADDTLTIAAGTISIEKSYEGLEALHLLLSGGNITLNASDDGLNAAGGTDQSGMGGRGQDRFGPPGMSMNSEGTIVISGGTLYIKAEGDGIDANGSL